MGSRLGREMPPHSEEAVAAGAGTVAADRPVVSRNLSAAGFTRSFAAL